MHEQQPYILLIDDDEDDIEMFSSGLEKKGIKVKTFDSSTKALFYLTLMSGNVDLPSLIIMDYNMPVKNGQQVLSLIKNNADTKDITVVMYSTSMSGTLKMQLLEAGALDCFDKPWTRQELNTQIEKFYELAYSSISNKKLA
ncbi:MAG TPA: response regulator [Flavisolibacter sp.]|nr:response regulator [Flavisolibacter sp.]